MQPTHRRGKHPAVQRYACPDRRQTSDRGSSLPVDHARQVAGLYEECGYVAAAIHSDMGDDAQEAVLERLRTGVLDCIVQVQMLGEGFDHPRLSVAAIFRPFRSLAPYIQFVGRVMRVVQQNKPDHPDNHGHVVSHVGLNNDERWSEFRELDLEDQAWLHGWVAGTEENVEPAASDSGPQSRRFDGGMVVDNEVLTSFIDQAYLDPTDDRVLEEMLAREVAPGLTLGDITTLEYLRTALLDRQAQQPADDPVAIPVSPQRRRQSARSRLNNRVGSGANRILDEIGLPRQGRQLAKVFKGPMAPNAQVVMRLLNKAVSDEVGEGRGDASAEDLERAFAKIDAIADEVRDNIARKLRREHVMPQIKSLLGHASVQTAVRQRICYRHRTGKTSHVIVKGETCLVIHGADGGDRNYCRDSAADILTKAQDDLDALTRGLQLGI
ncbi:DEAD/DEAH box helicase [Aeromicrobium sp. UC242_57]|uniref:DEAD/DEAH box helicase n=1 Tax=Aeromicrobium sp. UC242_57 TaxID=3374624 RepID=UPI0037A0E036